MRKPGNPFSKDAKTERGKAQAAAARANRTGDVREKTAGAARVAARLNDGVSVTRDDEADVIDDDGDEDVEVTQTSGTDVEPADTVAEDEHSEPFRLLPPGHHNDNGDGSSADAITVPARTVSRTRVSSNDNAVAKQSKTVRRSSSKKVLKTDSTGDLATDAAQDEQSSDTRGVRPAIPYSQFAADTPLGVTVQPAKPLSARAAKRLRPKPTGPAKRHKNQKKFGR